MKFKIEQIAIRPSHAPEARSLLRELGAETWHDDTVVAQGQVRGEPASNTAALAFNYDIADGLEFEVLDYLKGSNWVESTERGRGGKSNVCHLGMHCTEEELVRWRQFFATRGILVAQEVNTQSHTNPAIAGERWYNYVIFDTSEILGVDLKFIVRKDSPQ